MNYLEANNMTANVKQRGSISLCVWRITWIISRKNVSIKGGTQFKYLKAVNMHLKVIILGSLYSCENRTEPSREWLLHWTLRERFTCHNTGVCCYFWHFGLPGCYHRGMGVPPTPHPTCQAHAAIWISRGPRYLFWGNWFLLFADNEINCLIKRPIALYWL